MLDKKIQSLIWWGWSPLILAPWNDSNISLHFMFISHFYLNGNAGLICLFVLRFFGVSLMDCCGIVDKILKGCKSRCLCSAWWGCMLLWVLWVQQLAFQGGLCRLSPLHEQTPNIFNSQRLWTGCIQSWTCARGRLLKERSSKSFKVQ